MNKDGGICRVSFLYPTYDGLFDVRCSVFDVKNFKFTEFNR